MKNLLILGMLTFLCFDLSASTDKYRIVITDNPATTITIGWNQISGTSPMVHYGTEDKGTNFEEYPNVVGISNSISYRGMKNTFVNLKGLQPNTSYYFVIHDSEGTSERFWFNTAPADNSRLSFIAGGDSRSNPGIRRNANLIVGKLKPHAVLFGGDFTSGDTNSEWRSWFDDWQLTTSADGRMIPIVPTRGNHDGQGVVHKLFNVEEREYFAITFGNNLVRTYTLNTEISVSGNQKTWVENDLATHSPIWKVAQYHKPMRPHTSSKSEGNSEYASWAQMFFDFRVALVIDCDSHMAKTTWPVRPSVGPDSDEGFIRDDENGTVYAGEGCWGAPLRSADDDKDWTRDMASINQVKLIFVDTGLIEVRTIQTNNAPLVQESPNDNPFFLSSTLEIWNPSNGPVVEILPLKEIQKGNIEFAMLENSIFQSEAMITLDIEVIDEGPGIKEVRFSLNGVFLEADDSAPYSYSGVFPDGRNIVTAVAEDVTEQTDTETIEIIVGSFSEELFIPIISGLDDVEETEAGEVYVVSRDLELVHDKGTFNGVQIGNQVLGFRFEDLRIPQNANVTNAYIQFTVDETDTKPAELKISIEDSERASIINEDQLNNITKRTFFEESVTWTPEAWPTDNEVGTAQQTPNLAALLNKVVSKPEWEYGSDVLFSIMGSGISLTDPDAKRVAQSFEASAETAPQLIIEYIFQNPINTSTNTVIFDDVKIYPNPFDQFIMIENDYHDDIKLSVLNIQGVQVGADYIASKTKNYKFDTGHLISGIYFIIGSDTTGRELFVKKMVK